MRLFVFTNIMHPWKDWNSVILGKVLRFLPYNRTIVAQAFIANRNEKK